MKKIPNWRTWPVAVFAIPAAAVAGTALIGGVIEEFPHSSPLFGLLASLGISTVCFLVGYAGAEAARRLQRPKKPLITFVVDECQEVFRIGNDRPTVGDYDAALRSMTTGLDDLFRRTAPDLDRYLGEERARHELTQARRDRLRNARKAHVVAMLAEAARKQGDLVWAAVPPSPGALRRERLPWLRVRSGWAVAALVAGSVVAAGLAGWGVYELWAAGWVPQLLVPVLAVVCAGLLGCPVGVIMRRWRRDRDSF